MHTNLKGEAPVKNEERPIPYPAFRCIWHETAKIRALLDLSLLDLRGKPGVPKTLPPWPRPDTKIVLDRPDIGMSTDKGTPRILHLAATINESVKKLQDILSSQGVPSPSFDEDAPVPLPREVNDVRDVAIDAAAELYEILLEPMILLHKKAAV